MARLRYYVHGRQFRTFEWDETVNCVMKYYHRFFFFIHFHFVTLRVYDFFALPFLFIEFGLSFINNIGIGLLLGLLLRLGPILRMCEWWANHNKYGTTAEGGVLSHYVRFNLLFSYEKCHSQRGDDDDDDDIDYDGTRERVKDWITCEWFRCGPRWRRNASD